MKQKHTAGPILVVDDDHNLRQIIQWVLEEEGYTVATAIDGKEAVELAIAQQPALLVLDMGLPLLSGNEVAAQVRSHYGIDIPVMLITADGHIEEKSRQVGVSSFLRKPFEIDDLVAAVKQALKLRPDTAFL